MSVAEAGGLIYVLGGEDLDRTLASTEVYDPAQARWSTFAPLPSPRHSGGAVVLGGRLYSIGGSSEPGLSITDANDAIAIE